MKRLISSSLTRTAVFVVLLAALPALGILLASGIQRYEQSSNEVYKRGNSATRLVEERLELLNETTRTLFEVLAHAGRGRDTEQRQEFLRGLAGQYPTYGTVFALDDHGAIRGSLAGVDGGSTVPPDLVRSLFEGSVAATRLTRCPRHNEPAIIYIKGLEEGGGFIGATVHAAHFEQVLAGLELPAGSSFYLADDAGGLIAATPPGARRDVVLTSRMMIRARAEVSDSGHFISQGEGGDQLVSYQKVYLGKGEAPFAYLFSTMPKALAYQTPSNLLIRDMLLLAGACALALMAAWGSSRISLVRPVEKLLAVAHRLGSGDLSARVPDTEGSGEIAMLGQEINMMAEAIQFRDRELIRAREEAERSNKAKSQFLANMSHEIRTPMNAILGMAYLAMKSDLNPAQQGYIGKLFSAANTLLRIINDILDFSKIEAGKFTIEHISFSVPRLLATVRGEAAALAAEKGVPLHMRLAPEVPLQLMGDPLRLNQALTTLVREAITRCQQGEITLACDVGRKSATAAELHFSITDTGMGMPASQVTELRRIFAGDSREENAAISNNNLSMLICNRLFVMMGGEVHISSDMGVGTTYTAHLEFDIAPATAELQSVTFSGQRVLVVDSVDATRHSLGDMLTGFGLSVEEMPDRDQMIATLQEAEEQGSPYIFLFAEWHASSRHFLEQIGSVRTAGILGQPPIVVVTTSQNRAAIPLDFDEKGISVFLHRPINGSILFDTLTNLLAGQSLEVPSNAESETLSDANRFDGINILLVEDNLINQQIAEELLADAGISTSKVDNGKEALDLLANERYADGFDMVLMDLQMPVMDGLEATRGIRELGLNRQRLPVIAMTAHSDVQEINACFEAGMNDHIAKPITVEKLFTAIRRWLPSSAEHSSRILSQIRTLRGLAHKVPMLPSAVQRALRPILPMIHEGRAQLIAAALTGHDPRAVDLLLDELEAATIATAEIRTVGMGGQVERKGRPAVEDDAAE